MKRLTFLLPAAILTTALTVIVRPSFAATQCRPYGEYGQSSVLGNFYGAGLQCATDNLSYILGTRATQTAGGTYEPVVGLTYATSPWQDWTFRIKGDVREQMGDYEVNSLPELSLTWNSPHHDGAVQFSVAGVWGSYLPTTITVPIQRTEVLAAATLPKWQIDPAVNAQVVVSGGYASYSTTDVQSWAETDFNTWGQLGTMVDWNLSLGARAASGVSPLKFDAWTGDLQAVPGLTFHLGPQWSVSVSGAWNFQSATLASLSYEVRTTVLGPPLVFGYDSVAQMMTGTCDLPSFGNVGIRYDPVHSAIFAVFQPH